MVGPGLIQKVQIGKVYEPKNIPRQVFNLKATHRIACSMLEALLNNALVVAHSAAIGDTIAAIGPYTAIASRGHLELCNPPPTCYRSLSGPKGPRDSCSRSGGLQLELQHPL